MLLEDLALAITLAFLLGGLLFVLAWHRRGEERPEGGARAPRHVFQLPCSVCGVPMTFHARDLTPVEGAEKALATRADPSLVDKKLGEYVCPHCEAAHCFVLKRGGAEWVGVNFSQPQRHGSRCLECRRPLKAPSWPRGAYQSLSEIPQLLPEHGLVCSRCEAVCCVACCREATRRRTPDGSLVCPRCFRHPIEEVFYP